ncbi:hypothetical protein Efla_006279 [Eimeria flavescens]
MGSEPPVLLGYMSDRVPEDDRTPAEALSKFGGEPVWVDEKKPEDFPFTCCSCGAELAFVCQVATPYCSTKRCLYIFGCHEQPSCSKSPHNWKVVRGVLDPTASVRADESNSENAAAECTGKQQEETPTDPTDWLQAAFGSRTSGGGDKKCAGTSNQNGEEESRRPLAPSASQSCSAPSSRARELMPPYFVHVEDEPPDNSLDDATGRRARKLQLEYEQRVAHSSHACRSGILESEAYEESPDKVFLKLQKRLSRSPTQVIRYSFGGKPLFISPLSEEELLEIGVCPHCHSDRVFEMQLLPMAADEISQRSATKTPFEWGVVAVFTCKEDCIPTANYALEHVVVQEIL